MLDHMILTVSDVERSLAFHEAALKPLHIKFFMPYEGKDNLRRARRVLEPGPAADSAVTSRPRRRRSLCSLPESSPHVDVRLVD